MNVLGLDPLTWALVAVGFVIAAVVYVRGSGGKDPPRYAPATARQKAICAVLLAAMMAAWGVYFADWDVFGGHEKQVALVVQVLLLLYIIPLSDILERR